MVFKFFMLNFRPLLPASEIIALDNKLLEILVCPLCKGKLTYQKNTSEFICRADKLAFPIRNDIPIMLESEARSVSLDELER